MLAVYMGSSLSVRLPDGTFPPAVIAAADDALGAAGYVVTSRDTTAERGRVVGRTGTRKLGAQKVTVLARQSNRGTLVDIDIAPGGSEVVGRQMLERILNRLGL
ncbi:MAG: hypothetical protein AAF235_02185 [Planctomycetota bacterium]